MKRIPITGGTAPKGYQYSSERTVNWYNEKGLRPTPGLKEWQTMGNGPIRAFCHHKDWLMVVSGTTIYRATDTGSYTAVGTVGSANGRVKAISNGINAMFLTVDDGSGRIYDGSGTSTITDADFIALNATSLVFHDGFAVANRSGTGQWYISGSYDFSSWSSLDFATAEAKPDKLIDIVSDKNLLWLFGERTLEVWQNTGNADFPFEPLRSAFSHYGAYANTVQQLDNTLYWFGKNKDGGKCVLRLAGGADPQQVSDDRLNEWLNTLPDSEIAKAESFAVWWAGRSWYVLTFPEVDTFGRTIVMDTAGGWFEWSTYCESPNRHGRFRGRDHIYFAGKNLIADTLSGTIYELDANTYMDGDKVIKRTRRLDTMGADMEYVSWASFQAEMETGDGTPGTDYTMELRYSDDRGRSWSNSRSKSIGEGGEYSKRVIWRRLGTSRRRTWELNTVAAKDIRINAGYIEAA